MDTRTAGKRESSVRRGRGGQSVAAERPSRSKAAQRALDRRTRRHGAGGRLPITGRKIAGVPLVVPILALVLGTLALTLVLTTKSAQDSYAIDALREQNQELQAGADSLKQQVDAGDSAPALAKAAAQQGMVPATDSAEIIVGADGKARLRGTPSPAAGEALPDLNPEPDPVDKIDKSKVDDSEGLGGSSSDRQPSTTAPSTTQPSTSAPGTSQPSTAQPSTSTPAPNPRPTTNPTPSTNPAPSTNTTPDVRRQAGQATNVVPRSATPQSNTVPTR
ncbi:hypothetical protein [Gordonia hydrophobica]|uniref:Uncharacterized protein n=1 Tax=Gordonia hydrophobica TaxID=40516 RepID=A0ABZ2TYF7_9ACTN|nr:hypothetical protein [Gordonia hydrophobica]MBM7367108.1 hypothetical protein [Gordonia hydrophobica]